MARSVPAYRLIAISVLAAGLFVGNFASFAWAQKPVTREALQKKRAGLRPSAPSGYSKKVAVERQSEIDGVFPLANQSPAEMREEWNPDYDATEQAFELYVPDNYHKVNVGLPKLPAILFISPSDEPLGWAQCEALCKQQNVCFASPYKAGNNCPGPRRVRIVLDVLDQLRRTVGIDPDRTYIAGFSGGGRVAQQIAGALPEYFGGAMPICAAEMPREESWLRERMASRLSLALITGENDFNRGEVERWKGPLLSEVGIRTRVWMVPKMGHGVSNAKIIAEAFQWLEEGKADRAALAKEWPASCADASSVRDRSQQAGLLLIEAKERLEKPATLFSGLMQLKGIAARWPDLPEAETATKTLLEYEAKPDHAWAEEDIAEQRMYLIAEARGLTAYLTGELPPQYAQLKPRMATAALSMWQQILDDGQDAKAVAEAKRWIPELKDMVGK